jgi:hypothetical protein
MAALIGRLPHEVVESFQDSEPDRRVARLNDVTGDISLGMAPVINWLERRRPADTAELVKRHLCSVLDKAVLCAGHEIPEYAGGKVSRGGEVRSVGALRTATLVSEVRRFEQSLLGWANDIEAEESQAGPRDKRPEPETPFTRLKAVAKDLLLKGNELVIVNALADKGGTVPVKDLAVDLGWGPPYSEWNPARYRLNKKLRKHLWRLETEGGQAVAKPIQPSARK